MTKKIDKVSLLEVKLIGRTTGQREERRELERKIYEKYYSQYGAKIKHFAPTLITISNQKKDIAVIGATLAKNNRLFVENYLKEPIEHTLSNIGIHTNRNKLVELGNFVGLSPQTNKDAIFTAAALLRKMSPKPTHVLFTATQPLTYILKALRLPFSELSVALPDLSPNTLKQRCYTNMLRKKNGMMRCQNMKCNTKSKDCEMQIIFKQIRLQSLWQKTKKE